MAKTIISKTPTKAVVIISGAATETITMADLEVGEESAASPVVHITGITAQCQAATGNTITRNSVVLWNFSNSFASWRAEGWCDTREAASSIVVTIAAGGGTIVLELSKKSGFGDVAHENEET